jgi:phosphohistidine phosphatase
MKTLYLIRHAKSSWSVPDLSDIERDLSKRGFKDINTMGSYLSLKSISPDIILSSCALRAAQTSDLVAQKIKSSAPIHYLSEFYLASPESMKEIIMVQEAATQSMFVVGHNPQLTELANILTDEHIAKLPTMGVVAIEFDIKEWSELKEAKGKIDFFIYPKQFYYYMPKSMRKLLNNS